jgi:hypothetical protein
MEKDIVIILIDPETGNFDFAEFTQSDPKLIEMIEIAKEELLLKGIKFKQKDNLLITEEGIYCAIYLDFLKEHTVAEAEDFEPFSLN